MTSLQARFDQLMTGVGRGGGRIREGEKLGPSRHHCTLLATPRLDTPTSAGLVVLFSMAFQQHWWYSFQWNGWHSSNTWSLSYCNYCLIRRKWSLLASPQQIWNTINFSCHRRRHCCNHFDQCWIGCFVVIIWSAIDSGPILSKKLPCWQVIVWSISF